MKLGDCISQLIDKKLELKELIAHPVDYTDPITYLPDEIVRGMTIY